MRLGLCPANCKSRRSQFAIGSRDYWSLSRKIIKRTPDSLATKPLAYFFTRGQNRPPPHQTTNSGVYNSKQPYLMQWLASPFGGRANERVFKVIDMQLSLATTHWPVGVGQVQASLASCRYPGEYWAKAASIAGKTRINLSNSIQCEWTCWFRSVDPV